MRCEEYLEWAVGNYDKVVLIADDIRLNLHSGDIGKIDLTDKKILLLSSRHMEPIGTSVSCERISGEMVSQLRLLYHMYEFADNFILLEESHLYATIYNFVQTGLLTAGEAWQALLR